MNPMSLGECMVCGGAFTRDESREHSEVRCQPSPVKEGGRSFPPCRRASRAPEQQPVPVSHFLSGRPTVAHPNLFFAFAFSSGGALGHTAKCSPSFLELYTA